MTILTVGGKNRPAIHTEPTEITGGMTPRGRPPGCGSIMWIKLTNSDSDGNPVTRRLKTAGIDEFVEFSENGKAQVTKDVGELLTEQVNAVVPVEESEGGVAESDEDDMTHGTSSE